MRVIETAAEMRRARAGLRGKIALFATLGGVHAGHEAHLVRCRELADVTVGSLFLNPTQFGPNEDLSKYPHDRDKDLAVFERHGVTIVFAPPESEIYPPNASFTVDPGQIGTILEGARRPGHFVGVATVVTKLFAIIRPDFATFGEKDAQQLRIIQKLNRDLRFGIEIVPIPTVRETDGLAMSSRNGYLVGADRAAAAALYRALTAAEREWKAGERSAARLRAAACDVLSAETRVKTDYVSVADPVTLKELESVEDSALVSLAARVGPARLIDNILLTP